MAQEVAGLAVQLAAEGFQGGEANGLGLACLQDGQVGERQIHALR